MQGPNIDATLALARAIQTPVIASGGVASMDDLTALKEAGGDILDGVISGRAVYDGRIDPAAAGALLAGEGA
jgi:phosphoribosylformimino-5-aminoimidazole carboxamide ribotide isomerase